MTDKEENIKSRLKLLIDNIDEFGHKFVTYKAESMKSLLKDTLEYINNKEQECEELQEKTASIIYSLTGGRLSYSTYTLEGCADAYSDQLKMDVERATKELQEKLQAKEQECEELRGRLNTICFDSRANNNRCISYNRMAEDYEKDLKKLAKYKTLFFKAREIYQRTSKYNQQLIKENEDLKDTIKRFTCQSECYKHKEAEKYKQALDEIENYVRDNSDFDKSDKLTSNTGAYDILEIIKKQRSN